VAPAIEQPAWGQVRISEALKRRGLSISPAGVSLSIDYSSSSGEAHRMKRGSADEVIK
jgi:hypothetical protein